MPETALMRQNCAEGLSGVRPTDVMVNAIYLTCKKESLIRRIRFSVANFLN